VFFAAHMALVSAKLETVGWPKARRFLVLGVLLLVVAPPICVSLIAIGKPQECLRFNSGPTRTAKELASAYEPPEYVPRAAREAGWVPLVRRGEVLAGVQLEPVLVAGKAEIASFERQSGALRVKGLAASGTVLLLPQFWFPGWATAGSGGEISSDPATGLLRLTLSPGPFDVTVERRPLLMTRFAALFSLASLLGVISLTLEPIILRI